MISDVANPLRARNRATKQPRAFHDLIRRSAAIVIAISFHIVLLMLLMPPIFERRVAGNIEHGNPQAIQLRFFRRPASSSAAPMAPASPRGTATVSHARETPSVPSWARLPRRRATDPVRPQTHTRSGTFPALITQIAGEKAADIDGGFQQRLRNAQQTPAVRGIPGSDISFAPGIHLINPDEHGVGAVMRKAQRLFGVTNRHCIDVDVWRHMTLKERSARHLSSGDVDEADRKYQCNRPPGLSF